MKWRLSVATMAFFMFSLFLLSVTVSGANTYLITGCEKTSFHSRAMKPAVTYGHQYFLNDRKTGEYNWKKAYSAWPNEVCRDIQYQQPQQFIYIGHGTDDNGEKALVTGRSEKDYTKPTHLMNNLKGGRIKLYDVIAPGSSYVLVSCKQGGTAGTDWYDGIWNNIYPWVFVAWKNDVHVYWGETFVWWYSIGITIMKLDYLTAIQYADSVADNCYSTQKGLVIKYHKKTDLNYLAHDTIIDRWSKRTMVTAHQGSIITQGQTKTMQFSRVNTKWQSNGAYFIFHGVVQDDIDNTNNFVYVRITIEKYDTQQSKWVQIISYSKEYKNTKFTRPNRPTYYGGSTIGTWYITPGEFTSASNFQVKVKLESGNAASPKIEVHRFEIMEIST